MNNIIKNHPNGSDPLAISLQSNDIVTETGVPHRELIDTNHSDIFLKYMLPLLRIHHIKPNILEELKANIKLLKTPYIPLQLSPYPRNPNTRKCNFAEIFLAEYLKSTTDTKLPVYRLRFNPNKEESMKGDDVLLFDLDSTPVKIIVGEAKFRETPSKETVIEIVETLVRSNKEGLPISLTFVANRLFEEHNYELWWKVLNCSVLFSSDQLEIDYVGLLMSNMNANKHINRHTTNELHNLLMISLGMIKPEQTIEKAFNQLETEL
jgi:hypothetical protein